MTSTLEPGHTTALVQSPQRGRNRLPLGMTPLYGLTAVAAGAVFLFEAHRLAGSAFRGGPIRPMRLFHWSITYLTLLFVAVAVDSLLH